MAKENPQGNPAPAFELLGLPIDDGHLIKLSGSALIHDFRQSLVGPDRGVLKLPRLLARWRCSLPLELPGESSRKRPCDDAHGLPGELGILLGGFRESQAVQLRVDLNRGHAIIIVLRIHFSYFYRIRLPVRSLAAQARIPLVR